MKQIIPVFIFLVFVVACDDIIEVPDISNKTMTVLAPTNGVVLDTTQVNFSWEPLEDADVYQVQIATPSFENAQQIVIDSIFEGTSFEAILDYKAYEWRIRAQNSGYKTTYTTQSFSIEN